MLPEDEAEQEEETYAVWPENWDSVRVFLALETQWRRNDFSGQRIGLDYAAAEAAMRMMAVADQAAVFWGLRVMEGAVLEVEALED